jgi:4-hydroxy-3-polyprenylbenzoate decarboxylase
LGTGQLSLAKFLFITADETNQLSTQDVAGFFDHVLRRIDLTRDIHFYTNTTIDTLDYSGSELNKGSKVVLAAYGGEKRNLCKTIPGTMEPNRVWSTALLAIPGVVCISTPSFITYEKAAAEMNALDTLLRPQAALLKDLPLIVLCDDPSFTTHDLRNFLWITFTRCNPSHDIYGIDSFYRYKHWGCNGPLIIDARIKPHHAPVVEKDPEVEKKIERLFNKEGSLYRVLK